MQAIAALGDPTRRRIVELLRDGGEASAGQLGERFAISQPGVSRHLRVLRECGLVRVRVDGQRRLYALEPGPLAEIDQWLAPFRRTWEQRLDALDTEMQRGRQARNRTRKPTG